MMFEIFEKLPFKKQKTNFSKPLLGFFVGILTIFGSLFFANGASASGTFTSQIKYIANESDSFGNIDWVGNVPAGTELTIRVRSLTANNEANARATWSDDCNVANGMRNGTDINTNLSDQANPCVDDQDNYLQYQAIFTLNSGTEVPTLTSVTIETEKIYSLDFSKSYILSAPFNTNASFNKLSSASWNATRPDSGSTAGLVGFQFRSASNTTDLQTAQWCGPDSCGALATGGDANFYSTTSTQEMINSATYVGTQTQGLPDNNKYFQYATFLRAANPNDPVTAIPVLQNVTVAYSFNIPPVIDEVAYAQKTNELSNPGSVDISYKLTEVIDNNNTISHSTAYSSLFYQTSDITLSTGGIAETDTGLITLKNLDETPIPTEGMLLVDDEFIEFEFGKIENHVTSLQIKGDGDGSGVSTNGRGASLASDGNSSYRSTVTSHTENAKVYFKATKKVGGATLDMPTISPALTAVAPNNSTTRFFNWDPRLESNIALSGKKLENMNLLVVAHDGNDFGYNAIGKSAVVTSKTLDLAVPVITSITTDLAHKSTGTNKLHYKAGAQIPLTLTFSERVNFDPIGDEKITLHLNSGVCTIGNSINDSDTTTCSYSVGAGDNTPTGDYLNLISSQVSWDGKIEDNFGNILGSPSAPTNNLGAMTNIVIDSVDPTASDLIDKVAKATFSRTITAQDTNGSGIEKYQWLQTSGPGSITFSAPTSATTNISASVDGLYDIEVTVTDYAGNFRKKTMKFTRDTVNPTDAGKPDVPALTNNPRPTISWTQATGTGSGLTSYELQRKLGSDGWVAAATIIPATITSYTEESDLLNGSFTYRVITTDEAGNTSTSAISNPMVVDTITPKLGHFNSPNAEFDDTNQITIQNTTNGKGSEIIIKAVYDSPLKNGSKIQVQLENTADPAINVPLQNIDTNNRAILYGSYIVDGPRKGHDSERLTIRKILPTTPDFPGAIDDAGNVQTSTTIPENGNLGEIKQIMVDTGTPILTDFIAKQGARTSGSFNDDDSNKNVTITAKYSKKIDISKIHEIKIKLNTGGNGAEKDQEITLNQMSGIPADQDKVYGTYIIADGDNVADLKVTSIISQNVTDMLGNSLTDVLNIDPAISLPLSVGDYDNYFTSIPNQNIAVIKNMEMGVGQHFRIDTEAPKNTSIVINNNEGETRDGQVSLAIATQDNMGFADMQMLVSNNGINWCDKNGKDSTKAGYDTSVALDGEGRVTIPAWNIIGSDSNCGGADTGANKQEKTVRVKFIDPAGNSDAVTSVASDDISYDGSLPTIVSITTEAADKSIYGISSDDTTTQVQITVTYNEEIKSGSTVTLNFNTSGRAILETRSDTNTSALVGHYKVMSNENTDQLVVTDVVQNVIDTIDNVQNGTSVTGANLDAGGKSIIIDTTAPELASETNFTIDRSTATTHLGAIEEANIEAGVQFNVAVMPKHDDACIFDDATWKTYDPANHVNNDVTFEDASATNDSRKACLKFKDSVGNETDALKYVEIITPETPRGMQIDDISNSEINFYGSMLTWSTPFIKGTNDKFKQYEVAWCQGEGDVLTDSDCTPKFNIANAANIKTIGNLDTNYDVYPDLEISRKYCYLVRFKDEHGNYSKLPSPPACFDAGSDPIKSDSDVAIVSGNADDVLITDVTESSAKIVFQTYDSSTSRHLPTHAVIEAYTDMGLTAGKKTFEEPMEPVPFYGVGHSMTLNGLESGTVYYLKIFAYESSDTERTDPGELFYESTMVPKLSFETLGTLEKIEGIIEAVITDSKAVITFKTDQDAKCFIDFKNSLLAGYNEFSPREEELFKNHSVTLTQLVDSTNYDYKITCSDRNGVAVTSEEHHFATAKKGLTQGDVDAQLDKTAPIISNVSIANITGEGATVTWNTEEKASSFVVYGFENMEYMKFAGDQNVNLDTANYADAHSVILSGLISDSRYVFSVMSADASGNIAQSSVSALTTKQPSSLSSIKVVSTALGQATVTWNTGSPTNSVVNYGLTTSYGQTKQDSTTVKEHSITLADLTPGETYHFRVLSEDQQNNVFASSDITFQPKSPPKISDFKIDSITEHGAIISFATNVPTDALIIFTNTNDAEDSGVQGNPIINSKHNVAIKNLTSGGSFSIKVRVKDTDGNETEESFEGFTTTKDENPPKIDMVKTDLALTQNDKVQAIISWITDEQATTSVTYKEGRNGDPKEFKVSDNLTTNHVAVITSFKPGIVYYFNAKSKDASGNTASSNDFALLTPKKRQNIIQIIIGNFTDIFGWAKM